MTKSAHSPYTLLLFCIDIFLIGIIIVLSLSLINFYLKAEFINPSYPDWLVHAFRVKSLDQDGFMSWSHVWSNGISLWKAYQFIPHFITLIVMNSLDVSVTRAMVLVTIGQFVLLRLFLYGVLRFLSFSPITAFICALLSFDIAQYWGGVSDFSLLFGFTFFPLMVYLWVKYYEGKFTYMFPYLAGISFYIHPILGYSTAALWGIAIIFSGRRLLSFSILLQLLIFLSASSLFWFPIAYKASYAYTSEVFANKYFLSLVLSAYKYYGLSIFLIFALILAGVRIFMPLASNFRWVRILYIFVFSYFLLIVIGLSVDLPRALSQLQFTRGATIIGIGTVIVFAPVIESITKLRSLALKGILLFMISLAVIEGLWFTSDYSPPPGNRLVDPVTVFDQAYPEKQITDKRVWSSYIAHTSFLPPLSIRLPYSYMGHLDSNQVAPRISPLLLYQPYPDIVPAANLARVNDYFKLSGVKFILFDEKSPFTTTLVERETHLYKDLGVITDKDAMYHAFEVPWQVREAVLIDQSFEKKMTHFPYTLKLTDINDQIELDDYVKNFVGVIYDPKNTPLILSYPSSTMIEVSVPPDRTTPMVYINESFDAGWKGYFDGKNVELSPVGPNYTLAKLPSLERAGTLILKHNWPMSFYTSLFLIVLIPLQIGLYNIIRIGFIPEEKNI